MTHQRRADLTGFFESSTKIRGRLFNSFYLVQTLPSDASIATPGPKALVSAYVLASKKGVDKRAVLRNRAKRRLRVAQRTTLQNHPAQNSNYHIRWVIMAGRNTLKASWPDILKEVESQWLNVVKTLP